VVGDNDTDFLSVPSTAMDGLVEAGESWAGSVDNLRIYDRALSEAEVALVSAEPR
jgi:hypothetical protein